MIQRRLIPILCSLGMAFLCTANLAGACPKPVLRAAATVPHELDASTFEPWVAVSPVMATVGRGETVQFSVQMNEDPEGPSYIRQPINYTFLEKERFDGGIDLLTGVFTAPNHPGIYHVLVTREDFPECQALAVIQVLP